MPDPLDHATGLERQELLAKAAGNENPFDMKVYKRTSGELSNPTLIPSFYQSRIVGCICQEDATTINWMWLTKGEPKRCECGYFFKLEDAKPMV
ncbi:cytochrome c oxidase subunit 5B, mitochondrial [Armadillidium vulgare]|nr:cytochrome c oxidase subunit 5B, mitochondrial [Armadillidium vulgare]